MGKGGKDGTTNRRKGYNVFQKEGKIRPFMKKTRTLLFSVRGGKLRAR